jgi:NADH dehydrogenase FAD-containing subunit
MVQVPEKPNLVVIGGGFAGVTLAQKVADVASVTILDSKDYLEINWALVRAPVQPSIADKAVVPYGEIPVVKDCFKQGTVTNVDASHVHLKSGEAVPYDYLVFAFGSGYQDSGVKGLAGSTTQRRAALTEVHAKLAAAKSVLVVGGGPSGVEHAAEIATDMPEKKVTLVHSGSSLLADKVPKLGAVALKWLQKHNVQVILGERAHAAQPGVYVTSKSKQTIQADMVLWCTGTRPASSWLQASAPEVLDDKGLIKVNKNLQVLGHANWFALGDCNDVPETKMGYLATQQALALAKTLHSLLSVGPQKAKLQEYKPFNGMEAMLVTLGRKAGAMQVNKWVITGCIPTWLKSKDMMVAKTRKGVGLSA